MPAPFDDAPAARAVSEAVSAWVKQVERLLAQTQTALETLRENDGVPPEAQNVIYQLLVLVRQRRAHPPTPEEVRRWVRLLSAADTSSE